MRCVTQHDGRPVANTEQFILSNIANKVTSIMHCNSLFVVVVKSVINFSAPFENELGVSFLAAQAIDMVEDTVFV